MVSKFISKSKWSYYQAVVKILRYIKGTLKHEILFPSRESEDDEMICYSDSDWCEDRVDIRSTTGYRLMYLSAPSSWCSKKQSVVAFSTCEAKYISRALSAC